MAAYQYIYVMKKLSKIFPGGKKILEGVTLAFLPGAKIGVLGVNGAGKSTLLKIMAGLDQDFGGEAWAADGVKVGYLAQEPELDPSKDVLGNVMEGVAETKALLDRFDEVSAKFAEPMDDAEMDAVMAEQAELQEKIDAVDGWELQRTLDIAMDALRCPPGDADVSVLSGGERRRVALCRLLLSQPDMLLLDEPTNHLDAESVAWLERFLHDYKGTVVAITHDRYFLDNVAGWILEVDRGRGIPYEGNYSSWLEQKQKRLAQEEKEEQARQKHPRSRARMDQRQPARASGQEQGTYHGLRRSCSPRLRTELPGSAQIVIPAGARLGDTVIDAQKLTKGYGDRLLIDQLDFRLPPGGIVGVIGANGAGKTTLFRMITGQEQPDSGEPQGRRYGRARLCRPEPGQLECFQDSMGRDFRRPRRSRHRQAGRAFARLRLVLQLQRPGSAKESRPALGWRAQSCASGQAL